MPNPTDTPIDLSLLTAKEREMWEESQQESMLPIAAELRANTSTLLHTLAEMRKVLRKVKMCADCWPKNQQLQAVIKLLPKEEAEL